MQLRKWIHVTWFTDYGSAAPDNHIQKGGCKAWAGTWGPGGGAQRYSSIGFISVSCFQASRRTTPEYSFFPVFLLFSFPPFLCALSLHWKSTCRHRRGGVILYVKGGHSEQQESFSAIKAPWFIRQPACQTRGQRMTHWVIGGQDGEIAGQREGSQRGWVSNPDSAPV